MTFISNTCLLSSISLHTISNLSLLSYLFWLFFLITKFLGKWDHFHVSSALFYSPICFSQKEPVLSNWKHPIQSPRNLRFLQESLCSAILYHLIWFTPHLSFSFPFPLTSLILHDTSSSCFSETSFFSFSFSIFHYCSLQLHKCRNPHVSFSSLGCLAVLLISNSPMISTTTDVILSMISLKHLLFKVSADVFFK